MADDDSFNENWSDNNAEDDEGTLDEEEACDGDLDELDEIKMLEEEQDIPLDQLRAMYGFNPDEAEQEEEDGSVSVGEQEEKDEDEGEESVDVGFVNHIPHSRLLGPRGYFEVNDDEEADVDNDYVPPPTVNLWKRFISIGTLYQADVPPYDPNFDLGTDDRKNELLWKPEIGDSVLNDLMKRVYDKADCRESAVSSTSDFDNDYVLLKFLENNFEVDKTIEEVVEPLKENPIIDCNPAHRTLAIPRNAFTTNEIDAFEHALPVYGKNFTAIRAHTFPARKVGELVEFYYHWKKSERHDDFIERSRQRKLNAQEGDPPMLFPVFRNRVGRLSEPMDAIILAHHTARNLQTTPTTMTAENGTHLNGNCT